MIEKRYLIEENKDYSKFNYFEISDELEEILADDYYTYNSKEYKKDELVEKMYDINFVNKYDMEKQPEVFSLYINNEKFKEKVLFIYSILDENRYKKFVENHQEIENPNDLTIKYSVIDSDNTKVLMYNISIADIAFVF
ncbi:hypothetical protein LXN10_11895 [Arcobacter sp. KX21116]|jgi:hypothetical protein|uniref:hypothetical protein n=1 Tax=Arcobacter iocasae TaxID=2906515 RepID=UPI0035D50E5A|tara:strand:- start:957 stop:1373 length:417 start_codon:yes stop_codon:yes gene_type:complete